MRYELAVVPLAKAYSISNLNLAQLRDRNIMVSVPMGNICTSRGLVVMYVVSRKGAKAQRIKV
jgi:hypothetical protein